MYLLVFIFLILIVYIQTFKQDFEPEILQKAFPFVGLMIAFTFLSLIFSV